MLKEVQCTSLILRNPGLIFCHSLGNEERITITPEFLRMTHSCLKEVFIYNACSVCTSYTFSYFFSLRFSLSFMSFSWPKCSSTLNKKKTMTTSWIDVKERSLNRMICTKGNYCTCRIKHIVYM